MKNKLIILITSLITIFILPTLAYASPSMYLNPSSSTVGVGENITFDIDLANPSPAQSFDGLDVWLKFDPTKLEIQDTSIGNWSYLVSTETQIYDSSHFEDFNSFSFHGNNQVDNTNGWIFYSVGLALPPLTTSGTFAQATFKALELTDSTSIYFDYDGTSPSQSTRVLLGGSDYLDRLNTTGASVAVIPEPSSLILLGIGLMGLLGIGRFRRKGNGSI